MDKLAVTPRFRGVPIFLNGQRIIVPSLSMGQVRQNQELIEAKPPEGEPLVDHAKRMQPVILAAINRNYPDVTADDLDEWLDLNTYPEVYLAMRGASGLKVVGPGE